MSAIAVIAWWPKTPANDPRDSTLRERNPARISPAVLKLSPEQLQKRLTFFFSIAFFFWPGDRAMSSTLDDTLLVPVAAFGLGAVAFCASRQRSLGRRVDLKAAAFEALAPVLLALSVVHLANAHKADIGELW